MQPLAENEYAYGFAITTEIFREEGMIRRAVN